MSEPGTGRNAGDSPDNDELIEAGVEASFADGSVLESLASKLGNRPKVLLREEDSGRGAPVIDPTAAASAGLPKGRGNYQLLGEIARGGMGVVLKGHDADLGRDVALQVLHEDLVQDPQILQR